jgi:oxygen-independent coproporphyrinogen-3 oxidase
MIQDLAHDRTAEPPSRIPDGFAAHAERSLPRYTSYPTALAFGAEVDELAAHAWAVDVPVDEPISVYVHIPFCDQLCWYCGCHTTVPNGYRRISAYLERLHREIDLWAEALGPHGGASHLHFGGGSPNALSPGDFAALALHLRQAFRLRPGAEVAVELDPRSLDDAFVAALGESGVNRASLGVQTFDPVVQIKVNRIQSFKQIAWSTRALRDAGVEGLSFDLMYGLPGQTPRSVADSAHMAAQLGPDRISVFGYAHVPWFKKHQTLIREADLADLHGRWAQAEAADQALATDASYERIGLDHYALPADSLAEAVRQGRLHRNFQGYTVDAAEVLIPLGASAIGRFREGYVQNSRHTEAWAAAIVGGRLAVERGVAITPEDRLRARVIERLMCDLKVDVERACEAEGFPATFLDDPLQRATELQADGLCRVDGRMVSVPPRARRLVRAVAACFDAGADAAAGRHSRAV